MKAELPGLLGIAATGPHAFGAVLVWRERQSPLGRQLWLGFRKRSQAKGLGRGTGGTGTALPRGLGENSWLGTRWVRKDMGDL